MYNLLPFIHIAGISCPLASLRYRDDWGIGDIRGGYLFVDFLARSELSVWKMLPINELVEQNNFSPYDPLSAFALDLLYVDITRLVDYPYTHICHDFIKEKKGLYTSTHIYYKEVLFVKKRILQKAFKHFIDEAYTKNHIRTQSFDTFMQTQAFWLTDYALYKALQKKFDPLDVKDWPQAVRMHKEEVLARYAKELHTDILYFSYVQWILAEQFMELKRYANSNGVSLIGDVSFYIGCTSVDVWAGKESFRITKNLQASAYGGNPPDTYAPDGQLWKVALYNWKRMATNKYDWWIRRLEYLATYFDSLRLDHFRGFMQYWKIPIDKGPKDGKWVKGPGMDFLNMVVKQIEDKQLCMLFAEDLGIITERIEIARKKLGICGYSVFYYDYALLSTHQLPQNTLLQTSTHDTHPLTRWWRHLSAKDKRLVANMVKHISIPDTLTDDLRWKLIAYIFSLRARATLFPIQDILGESDTINTPSALRGSWVYRMHTDLDDVLHDEKLIKKLSGLVCTYGVNKFYEIKTIHSVPLCDGMTCRVYQRGEAIPMWLCAGQKQRMSMQIYDSSGNIIYEVAAKLIHQFEQGVLYKAEIVLDMAGIFTLGINNDQSCVLPMTITEAS